MTKEPLNTQSLLRSHGCARLPQLGLKPRILPQAYSSPCYTQTYAGGRGRLNQDLDTAGPKECPEGSQRLFRAADCFGVEARGSTSRAWGPRRAWERLGTGLGNAHARPDG